MPVLNVGKMAPGSEDYYLSQVADGSEEYYLRRGEAPGRWLGRGLDPVGLERGAKVEADALRAVLAGDDPSSGVRLASHPARKIPGFDMTFRAPKSVSIAWALGDQHTAGQVQAAHDAGVKAAVGYLERHALRTRRGAGGVERVEVDGLIGAAFTHRTSRAGDPLLHTHVLAANLVRASDDGKWRTFESRRMYQHAKTAGFLYQAQLRHELTERLGVEWGPVTNGYADIAGIDRQLIDAFSQRRQAILDKLAERGESSAKAAQVATLSTRDAKGVQPTERELRAGWAARARELGFDRSDLERLLNRHTAEAPDVDVLAEELVGDEALTAKAATFTRRDLLRAVAERLPDGATVEDIEQLAEAVLAAGRDQVITLGATRGRLSSVDVIRTADGRTIAGGTDDEVRMTTRGLLLAEQHAINTSIARQDDDAATVDAETIRRVMAVHPTLTGEQIDMLTRLSRDGDGVTVVVGKAGTGKTFALDAARHAWQSSGIDMHGVALAARAAQELQDSAGIPSTTIHKLLHDIDRGVGSPLVPGSVLVVDEAGMVGTRQLARLLDHCEAQRVKVVLVGDPHQLPEIDAGGLFSTLTQRLDAIELTDNRRQTQAWEIDALDRLRHGDPADALGLYDEHGQLVTGDTAEGLREQLVSDWWHARHQVGADQAVMIALRQTDVDDLNQRARLRADAAGHLTGPVLETDDGRTFRAGDRILCLRNDRRLGVVNGTFATITDITDDGGLSAVDDRGTVLHLPEAYVQAGHVAHGYAITGHKAQGLTVDHAFVLGSDLLYREWGYVAMSRGRHTNRLYVHPATDDPHDIHHHQQQPDPDPHTRTVAGLRRSAAQTPAVAFLPDSYDVEQVRQTATRFVDLGRRITQVQDTRRQLVQAEQEASDAYEAAVAAIHHAEARRQELSGIRQLRRGTRQEIEQLYRQIDDGRNRLHDLHRQRTLARRKLTQLPDDAQVDAWKTERADLAHQLHQVVQQRTAAVLRQPPGYLTATIGTPPATGPEHETWAKAARLVEEYRTLYDVRDPTSPLGQPRPADPQQQATRNQALDALLEVTRQQRTHEAGRQVDRDPPARGLGRGISR